MRRDSRDHALRTTFDLAADPTARKRSSRSTHWPEAASPELQFPVGPYLLDLAYPKIRLAVEYDGRDHRTADRALHDLHREAYLTKRGWDVLRLRASVVHDPREVAVRVHRELFTRGATSGSPVGSRPHW